jgi:hypothetical protein
MKTYISKAVSIALMAVLTLTVPVMAHDGGDMPADPATAVTAADGNEKSAGEDALKSAPQEGEKSADAAAAEGSGKEQDAEDSDKTGDRGDETGTVKPAEGSSDTEDPRPEKDGEAPVRESADEEDKENACNADNTDNAASVIPDKVPGEAEAPEVPVVFRSEGGPEISIVDGIPVYHTAGRYELVSISADLDAGEYSAGEEIPEEEIPAIKFEPGTTVTFFFDRAEKDDLGISRDPSGSAIYDGVWDEKTGSVT